MLATPPADWAVRSTPSGAPLADMSVGERHVGPAQRAAGGAADESTEHKEQPKPKPEDPPEISAGRARMLAMAGGWGR